MTAQWDLFSAVEAGNAQLAQASLASGALVNRFDRHGHTPLIRAIQLADHRAHYMEFIRVLLAAGARLDLKSFNGWTPLMHAARHGQYEACGMLLDAGAAVDEGSYKGRTPLMLAAYHTHAPVLRLLLARGAAPGVTDADGRNALDFVRLRPNVARTRECQDMLIHAASQADLTRSNQPKAQPDRGRRGAIAPDRFADEFTQFKHAPLKAPLLVLAALLTSLLAVPGVQAWWGILVALAGAGVLVAAFPSIRQLPHLLRTEPTGPALDEAAPVRLEGTAEAGQGLLDAYSNFMRLGWGKQVEMLRARRPRLSHTRSHLASIGLALSIVLVIVALAATGTGSGWLDALLPAAATLAALVLEGRLRQGRLRVFQAHLDQVAAGINDNLTKAVGQTPGPDDPYVLYLRTFGVTGELKVAGVDFETSMAYNLASVLPMIALGHPGEAAGAGRIKTDDVRWREDILRLVEHATRIMLIPSHRPGTKWEVERVKTLDHLAKTIFAMPPEMRFGDGWYSTEWNRAGSALSSIGLELPLHYPKGLLFLVGPDGGIVDHAPLQAEEFLRELMNRPDVEKHGKRKRISDLNDMGDDDLDDIDDNAHDDPSGGDAGASGLGESGDDGAANPAALDVAVAAAAAAAAAASSHAQAGGHDHGGGDSAGGDSGAGPG